MTRLLVPSFAVLLACALACGGVVEETPRTETQPVCVDEDVETGSAPSALDARGEDVAWGTEDGTVAVRRSGVTTILGRLDARVRALALTPVAVFAAPTSGPVTRFDLVTRAAVTAIADATQPVALATNGDVTCYLDRASGRGWLRCLRGDAIVLETHDLSSANALAIDEKNAYVSRWPTTLRIPLDGAPPVEIAPRAATTIANDAARVYVATDGAATVLLRARLRAWAESGTELGTDGAPVLDERGTLTGLAITGGSAWVALDASPARIVRTPVGGGTSVTVAVAPTGGWGLLRGGTRALFRAWRGATPPPRIEKRCF